MTDHCPVYFDSRDCSLYFPQDLTPNPAYDCKLLRDHGGLHRSGLVFWRLIRYRDDKVDDLELELANLKALAQQTLPGLS